MVFNTTFNNISAISVEVSFIGGGNRSNLIRKQTRKLYTTQPEHRSHKVANIRCFILIKCSEQKARFKKYAIMS
jgi:hypothetical protein